MKIPSFLTQLPAQLLPSVFGPYLRDEMWGSVSKVHAEFRKKAGFTDQVAKGNFKKEEYQQYIRDLKLIYKTIEARIDTLARQENVSWGEFFPPEMRRRDLISEDVTFWDAKGLEPSEAAKDYADYIKTLNQSQLTAHIWTRYGGDMAGGQKIANGLKSWLRKNEEKSGSDKGVACYTFKPKSAHLIVFRKRTWPKALETFSQSIGFNRSEVLKEAPVAFRRAATLFPSPAA